MGQLTALLITVAKANILISIIQSRIVSFHYTKKISQPNDKLPDESVDIKAEVLELKPLNFEQNKKPPLPEEKSININKAGMNQLISLPGIGEKTAQKIILLRDERGGLKNVEELMDVRGIGKVKFNKIKKFLYIE